LYRSLNARALGLDLSAGETIDLALRHGFGGVDLLVRDLVESGSDLAALRARIADAGLRGGAWPLPVHWRGAAEEFQRDLARLPRLAAAAATLDLRRTGTWVMPETPESLAGSGDAASRRAATAALHVERLGAVARVLEREGVRLGLEVIGVDASRTGRGEPFVHRLGDLDAALGALRRTAANVGLLVDGFHLYAAGEPIEAALSWGVAQVVWVHVADLPRSAPPDRAAIRDGHRGLPGDHPAVPTAELLRQLAAAGYDGPVTPEPMAGCPALSGLSPGEAVGLLAHALRHVWPDLIPRDPAPGPGG
jgi:sugar phosphate isomerase/epimerase